jgi:hypothetical protein
MKTRVALCVWFVLTGALCFGRAHAAAATASADITDARYGAVAGDGKDDTVAIQKAIDDLEEGGSLLIPPGVFTVNMAKGLTISKKRIHVVLKGTITATTGGLESPECRSLFDVTGEGCQFIGEGGMLCGDGATFHGDYSPAMYRGLYPALVYFQANDCSISGLCLRDPPGCHLVVIGTSNCRITNCVIEGGTSKERDKNSIDPCSRYYGVFFTGTTGLLIEGNQFRPLNGRAQWQWVTSSSTNWSPETSIIGNAFEGAFDHPIYCSGIVKSIVSGNTVRDPGTSAIKLIGTDLVVVGNNISNALYGGIETRNGSRCIVAHNLVQGFGHEGISITSYNAAKGSFSDNIVEGNILIGFTDPRKPPVMSGVNITASETVSRCRVAGNIIHNTGAGNPALDAKLPGEPAITVSGGAPSDSVAITGNTIYKARSDGIRAENLRSSIIADNLINCAGEPVLQKNGKDNVVANNIRSTNQ